MCKWWTDLWRGEDGPRIETQSISDLWQFTDPELIGKISDIIKSVDTDKLKSILDAVEIDNEGWLHIKIDLRIKKND